MTQTEPNGTQTAPGEAAKGARDGARETGPALELHYRFILWLVPTRDRFPRAQRFLLGRVRWGLSFYDEWNCSLTSGQSVTITMESAAVDSYLTSN